MNKIIITHLYDKLLTCELEDDIVVTLNFEEDSNIRLDDIYMGRIDKLQKNISAAFVNIGIDKPCFMGLEGRTYKEGEEIAVQIKTEGIKTKAPEVSPVLSIPGRYVVVTREPYSLGISAKIPYDERRFNIARLFDSTYSYDDEFSFIIRTNAEGAKDEQLLAEANEHMALLKDIEERSRHAALYSKLYSGCAFYLDKLRDMKEGTEVITDDRDIFDGISKRFPGADIKLYNDNMVSLAKLYKLESTTEQALSERVWLKSGGFLVISPTEAMTVIDVNTGKNDDRKNSEDTYLKTNLEAAHEIARQLRLRNISGIIVIDFINMKIAANADRLVNELKELLKKDTVPAVYVDTTKLGLVELTRKKAYKSLKEQMESGN